MNSPLEFYQQSVKSCLTKIRFLQRRLALLSVARLLAFILVTLFIIFYATSGKAGWLPAAGACVALFAFLLKIYFNLKSEKNLQEKLLFINQNEIQVLHHQPNKFYNGSNHPDDSIFSEDLDIFGERSLYHYLNRTTTAHGGSRLAHLLNSPFLDTKAIQAQQQAVMQLSAQPILRQMVTARGLLRDGSEGRLEEINQWINTKSHLTNQRWIKIIRFILPAANVASLLYFLDTNNPLFLLTGIFFTWAIILPYSKYIQEQHTLIGKKQAMLEQYASVLGEFSKADPANSSLLQQLARTSSTGKDEVKKLSRLAGLLDQRLNLLVPVFMNSLFMYDIHVMIALEQWKQANRERFSEWIDAVAEIETLNSLATFAFNHPQYCFPVASPGTPHIEAFGMAHPLIPENEVVPNDLTAGRSEKLLLVTGSNMSGKSTFLRSAGINLLLAQCGAPVCAQQFNFSPMHILSSIRISDSLQEHTSYFMAELKRLRNIITSVESGVPSLVLIDEVLRGTNSNDKTHGSEALIKKLINFNCLALFATHDLALSELENSYPAAVRNYCFESRIENGELFFDYKLHRGVATNKNATFLMQKMGIIST